MLDLYKLHIFTVVVQEGSFSSAAERLYLTQSAISQHIQQLESSLGVQLFIRGRRGVTLTAEGHTLADYTHRIFALVGETETAVTRVDRLDSGQVVIGATPGAGVYLLPEWAQLFREQYPALSVSIQTGVTRKIVDDLLANRLEIGLIEGELDHQRESRLAVTVLAAVEQFVVVSNQPGLHPWQALDAVPISALNGQTFIMRPRASQTRVWMDAMLRQHNVEPVIAAEYDNLEAIKRLVAAGSGITILPEYVIRQEIALGLLHLVRITGVTFCRELKLIAASDRGLSPVARAFVALLTAQPW